MCGNSYCVIVDKVWWFRARPVDDIFQVFVTFFFLIAHTSLSVSLSLVLLSRCFGFGSSVFLSQVLGAFVLVISSVCEQVNS